MRASAFGWYSAVKPAKKHYKGAWKACQIWDGIKIDPE
jgi:hypothetical protein